MRRRRGEHLRTRSTTSTRTFKICSRRVPILRPLPTCWDVGCQRPTGLWTPILQTHRLLVGHAFLLGAERTTELSRGIGRLSAYFNVYTAPAVAGSLAAWHQVAGDSAWRGQPDARQQLYLQIRRWYELLILGQDPSTLVKPYVILKSWRAAVSGVELIRHPAGHPWRKSRVGRRPVVSGDLWQIERLGEHPPWGGERSRRHRCGGSGQAKEHRRSGDCSASTGCVHGSCRRRHHNPPHPSRQERERNAQDRRASLSTPRSNDGRVGIEPRSGP
jgi:hypothetical protein